MALIPTCDPSSQGRCVVTRAPRELRFSMEAKSVRRGSRTGKIDTSNRVAVRSSLRPSSIQPHFGRRYLRIRNTSLGTGLQYGEYPFSPRLKSSLHPPAPFPTFHPHTTV